MPTGLERLSAMFARATTENRGALMPFLVGGHPNPQQSQGLIVAAAEAGADALEIGFPFSDPIADGPVVAAAMHQALIAGASPRFVLDDVAAIRSKTDIALIAMVSVSIVARFGGASSFVQQASRAGFDGFIFPDISVEESRPYVEACASASVGCSLLIAPSTPQDRAAAIADACTGFVYALARAGITGEQSEAPDIAASVDRIREVTSLPIAVGFGISNATHVRAVVTHADAAIVGSALVRRISNDPTQCSRVVSEFVSALRDGCMRD